MAAARTTIVITRACSFIRETLARTGGIDVVRLGDGVLAVVLATSSGRAPVASEMAGR
jgi:hypothetical protein